MNQLIVLAGVQLIKISCYCELDEWPSLDSRFKPMTISIQHSEGLASGDPPEADAQMKQPLAMKIRPYSASHHSLLLDRRATVRAGTVPNVLADACCPRQRVPKHETVLRHQSKSGGGTSKEVEESSSTAIRSKAYSIICRKPSAARDVTKILPSSTCFRA